MNKNNKSGTTGVYFDVKGKKYRAQISFFGKKIKLGSFQTEKEAINARRQAEEEYKIENYKKVKLDLGLAHFVLQKVLGYKREDELYQLIYSNYAVPALLFTFLNVDDLEGNNFVWKAVEQIKNDVEKRIFHPVFSPLKNQQLYDQNDLMIFVDYLSGWKLPDAAKRNACSYATAKRRILTFRDDMSKRLS